MTTDISLFSMVGYRFAKLLVDEHPVEEASGKKVALNIKVGIEEPYVSKTPVDGREVIELELRIDVELADESCSKELESRTVINVCCVAGFVGDPKKNDGNLELFLPLAQQYARSMYWLARQRVMSLLTMTKLRGFNLPWDPGTLAENDEESLDKSAAR